MRSALVGILLLAMAAPGAFAQTDHRYGVEIKTHYRDSDSTRLLNPFPFPPSFLPVGQDRGFFETVEPGEHWELSVITLWYRGQYGPNWAAQFKLDLVDRYDRNPTSDDNEWDIDAAWLRWGQETEPGDWHDESTTAYVKLGKFGKFERQDDRHLESYGLVSTAFNRMEDVGVELGVDFGETFYLKGSFTQGNPVFIRDPNALAGDNGTEILLQPNPVPELGPGIVIAYDADVELDDLDFENPEIGVGVGARFGDDAGTWNLDVLAWGYQRDLADTVELEGTFYGGDLDFLLGPGNATPFAVTDDTKEEIGANLWLYVGGFSLFAQYVDQDLAGMAREGFEVEVAWDVELPTDRYLFGRRVLPFVAPAVRYSELSPDFPGGGSHPAISIKWDWDKIDAGVRLGLLEDLLDLTVEYADNTFVRAGRDESQDELLATFRLSWGSGT